MKLFCIFNIQLSYYTFDQPLNFHLSFQRPIMLGLYWIINKIILVDTNFRKLGGAFKLFSA